MTRTHMRPVHISSADPDYSGLVCYVFLDRCSQRFDFVGRDTAEDAEEGIEQATGPGGLQPPLCVAAISKDWEATLSSDPLQSRRPLLEAPPWTTPTSFTMRT